MALALTKREMEIAAGVWRGLTELEIATELGISPMTVKRHKTNIFNRTGMSTSVELALWVERQHGDHLPAPKSAVIRVKGETASFHVRTRQTVHGPELQIEVIAT